MMKKCKECGDTNVENAKHILFSCSYLANYYCVTCKEYKFPHNLVEVE